MTIFSRSNRDKSVSAKFKRASEKQAKRDAKHAARIAADKEKTAQRKIELAPHDKDIDLKAADKRLKYLAKHLGKEAYKAARNRETIAAFEAPVLYNNINDDTKKVFSAFQPEEVTVRIPHNAFSRLRVNEIKSLSGYKELERVIREEKYKVGLQISDGKVRIDFQPAAPVAARGFRPAIS